MGYFSLGFAIKISFGIFGIIILIWGVGGLVKQTLEDYFEPQDFNEDDNEDEDDDDNDDNSHSIVY